MCSRIFSFIRICVYIAIDVIVFFTCSVTDFADGIQWPFFKEGYDYLKKILATLFGNKRRHSGVSTSEEFNSEVLQRGNAYVEELLREINAISISRPFKVGDKVIQFKNLKAELRLCPSLQMHHDFKRTAHCSLRKVFERLRVNASVSGSKLLLQVAVQIKFLNFTKVLYVSGVIPYIETYLEFSFNNETLDNGILTELIVLDMHRMKLRFVGAGPLNLILYFTANNLLSVFKRRVTALLQNEIQTQLSILIAKLRFPAVAMVPSLIKDLTVEQQEAVSRMAEPSSLEEQHRVVSHTTEPSPPEEHQVVSRTPECPISDDQGSKPPTPEIPVPVTLNQELDFSSSSDETDTPETDDSDF